MNITRRIINAIQAFRYPSSPNATLLSSKEKDAREIISNYTDKIDKIRKLYFDTASKGSLVAKRIINYRAGAIAGGELKVFGKENVVNVLKDWMNQEQIFEKTLQYSELLEREGRLAIALYKRDDGTLGLRALSWHQYKYRLLYDKYEKITGIIYDSEQGKMEIKAPWLIYMQYSGQDEFSGETIAPPVVGYCLDDIEQVENGLQHWSQVNKLFADPTPYFEVEDENWFDQIVNILKGKPRIESSEIAAEDGRRWKIGEGLALYKTKLSYIQATLQGVDSLDKNIQIRMQRIFFATSIPIYLLYPELMSNRATAKELAFELNAAISSEKTKQQNMWEQVFKSYCIASNTLLGTALDPTGIYTILPQVSASYIQMLIETFSPLHDKKIISSKTFREFIPTIDQELEDERLNEEGGQDVSRINDLIGEMQ